MRKLLVLLPLLFICSAAALADSLSELAVSAPKMTTTVEATAGILPWGQPVNLASLNDSIISDYRTSFGRVYFPVDSLAERGIVAVRTASGTGSAWVTSTLCQSGYEASGLDATMAFTLSVPFSPARITVFTPSILADNNPRLLFRASAEKLLTSVDGQLQLETAANAILFVQAINPADSKTELWWRVENFGQVSVSAVAADDLLGTPDTVITTSTKGDINADGKVTVADATLALRASVGLLTLTLTQTEQADVTGDGKVTPADATTILRLALGLG